MITEKVGELRSAVKGFITRLMILAAIVVFGAIAIAQAQRGRDAETAAAAIKPDLFQPPAGPIRATLPPANQAAFVESSLSDETTSTEFADDSSTADSYRQATGRSADDPSNRQSEVDTVDYTEPADETAKGSELPPAESAQRTDDAPPLLSDDIPAEASSQPRRNPYREREQPAASDDLPPLLDNNDGADPAADQTTGSEPKSNDSLSSEDSAAGSDQTADSLDDLEPIRVDVNASQDNSKTGLDETRNDIEPLTDRANESDNQFDRTERVNDQPQQSYDLTDRANPTSKGRPGPQSLEGPQAPSLTVEKIAPPEVQVGKPARFQVRVRNVGQVAADKVLIRDEIPEGTNLIDASPEAASASNGALMWEVGTINPGDESVVTVELMPVTEGQIGSTATVSFQTSATARARATKPTLTLEHTAPKQVMTGENVRFTIKLSNTGSGTAQQVVIEEDVPDGLSHTSGAKLEYAVGTIPAGTSRHLELVLKAAHAGKVINTLLARGDAGLAAKDIIELEVVAPQLQIGISGPSRRYLEREATFTVSVANPGTAAARNVQLAAELPTGLKFISTNNSGHYDQARHAVIWSLEQLPAGEMGKAQFIAMPTEMGQHRIRAEAKAEPGLTADKEHALAVEGIAALYFGVVDQTDPIEVGGTTTYIINVENQGSKTASNVRFVVEVPSGMKPVSGDGTTQAVVRGQQIIFEPIDRLPPKAKTSFRAFVQGTSPGDQKLRVQMTSDDISAPVIKEESTRVYAD